MSCFLTHKCYGNEATYLKKKWLKHTQNIFFSVFFTISLSFFSEITCEIKISGNENPDFQ